MLGDFILKYLEPSLLIYFHLLSLLILAEFRKIIHRYRAIPKNGLKNADQPIMFPSCRRDECDLRIPIGEYTPNSNDLVAIIMALWRLPSRILNSNESSSESEQCQGHCHLQPAVQCHSRELARPWRATSLVLVFDHIRTEECLFQS